VKILENAAFFKRERSNAWPVGKLEGSETLERLAPRERSLAFERWSAQKKGRSKLASVP
jgi:hypothetical protein